MHKNFKKRERLPIKKWYLLFSGFLWAKCWQDPSVMMIFLYQNLISWPTVWVMLLGIKWVSKAYHMFYPITFVRQFQFQFQWIWNHDRCFPVKVILFLEFVKKCFDAVRHKCLGDTYGNWMKFTRFTMWFPITIKWQFHFKWICNYTNFCFPVKVMYFRMFLVLVWTDVWVDKVYCALPLNVCVAVSFPIVYAII